MSSVRTGTCRSHRRELRLLDMSSWGDAHDAPRLTDVLTSLELPTRSIEINLAALPPETRPVFVDALLLQLQALHDRAGRPHCILIHHAHHFLTGESGGQRDPALVGSDHDLFDGRGQSVTGRRVERREARPSPPGSRWATRRSWPARRRTFRPSWPAARCAGSLCCDLRPAATSVTSTDEATVPG